MLTMEMILGRAPNPRVVVSEKLFKGGGGFLAV